MRAPRARGRRVAVIADGGGHGSVAADLLTANGLDVPVFSDALVARIEPQLEQAGGMRNPIDIIDGADGLASFTGIARACLESGEVDAVMLSGYYGGYALYSDDYREEEPREARALAALQGELGRPIVDALAVRRRDRRRHRPARQRPGHLRAQRAGRARRRRAGHAATRCPRSRPPRPRRRCRARPGYVEARALLLEAGIAYGDGGARAATPTRPSRWPTRSRSTPSRSRPSTPRSCTSRTPGACASACPTPRRCAPPRSRWRRRLSPELLFVERTADVANGVELVVGATRDARFGAVVLVGLGGILVETLRDTALALAPLDLAAAERLLRSLRAAPMLDGVRGRPAVDVAAAARAVVALGDAMAAHPEIAELEINPLLVTPHGAIALDARVALGTHTPSNPTE